MEMSALYAIGKFRGVEVLGMVIISDELFRDRWVSGFKSPTMLLNFIKAGSLALKVLSK
jgi:purine-nucleoside phosphorylase